jgi:hypothetical protein
LRKIDSTSIRRDSRFPFHSCFSLTSEGTLVLLGALAAGGGNGDTNLRSVDAVVGANAGRDGRAARERRLVQRGGTRTTGRSGLDRSVAIKRGCDERNDGMAARTGRELGHVLLSELGHGGPSSKRRVGMNDRRKRETNR